jgi:hypothetical protein
MTLRTVPLSNQSDTAAASDGWSTIGNSRQLMLSNPACVKFAYSNGRVAKHEQRGPWRQVHAHVGVHRDRRCGQAQQICFFRRRPDRGGKETTSLEHAKYLLYGLVRLGKMHESE